MDSLVDLFQSHVLSAIKNICYMAIFKLYQQGLVLSIFDQEIDDLILDFFVLGHNNQKCIEYLEFE
jgi:hypothetical protein